MCAGSEVMQSGMGWGEERTLGTGLPALAGEEYVACVPDDSSGAVALVAFSAAPEGPLAPEACSALCFAAGQALAALSEQGRCLCGAARPPNASSACLPSCSGPSLPPAPPPKESDSTLLGFSIVFKVPQLTLRGFLDGSVGKEATCSAGDAGSIPVLFRVNFIAFIA